jgi:hypothetical protein
MKKETHLHVRASSDMINKTKELAKAQNRSVSNYLETLINKEYVLLQLGLESTGVEPIEGAEEIMSDIVIVNWKDYVCGNVDKNDASAMEKLEKQLKKDGWLDVRGNLVLVEDGEDYTKQFWQKYDVCFDEKILGK